MMAPPGPIVIGVDGSPNSQHALAAAREQASALGVELIVVHAIGLTELIDGERVPAFGHRDEIEKMIDDWCNVLRDAGHSDFEVRLLDGPPVDTLLRAADEADASLIVVGRRGDGGHSELRLGSTAHEIIEHTFRPVLIVPPHPEGA